MAFRRVSGRLARDCWVQPSKATIRRCCRAAGGVVLDEAYQEWIVIELSGILCVEDVYKRDLALLLAVDPSAYMEAGQHDDRHG